MTEEIKKKRERLKRKINTILRYSGDPDVVKRFWRNTEYYPAYMDIPMKLFSAIGPLYTRDNRTFGRKILFYLKNYRYSFRWDDTPEGINYWNSIFRKITSELYTCQPLP